jgi:hypothetical protein
MFQKFLKSLKNKILDIADILKFLFFITYTKPNTSFFFKDNNSTINELFFQVYFLFFKLKFF